MTEREQPDFDEQDSGAPVTSPDRNPDPLDPEHSVPSGAGGGSAQDAPGPAEHVRDQHAGDDASPPIEDEGGPAVPDRQSGLSESNPAEGL